jgi:hypothetical protein
VGAKLELLRVLLVSRSPPMHGSVDGGCARGRKQVGRRFQSTRRLACRSEPKSRPPSLHITLLHSPRYTKRLRSNFEFNKASIAYEISIVIIPLHAMTSLRHFGTMTTSSSYRVA